MENKEKRIDIPGQAIKILCRLRGLSQRQIAKEYGISYHLLNKFLCRGYYVTDKGHRGEYKLPHIRKALSESLNLPENVLFGSQGVDELKRLIGEESLKKTRKTHNPARKKWSLAAFVRGLIRLGYVPVNEKP